MPLMLRCAAGMILMADAMTLPRRVALELKGIAMIVVLYVLLVNGISTLTLMIGFAQ
jgi:hypothetical protein